MRKMGNNRNYDFDDALNCWDLPVFARVVDFCKVIYHFAPVCILEVICIICICYYILLIILYTGRALVAMPDHRIHQAGFSWAVFAVQCKAHHRGT
jgi:hypothetical protein